MERQTEVTISKLAHKQIQKIPLHIQDALKGNRNGQRSVRLTRSHRVIYEETSNGHVILIVILEVHI